MKLKKIMALVGSETLAAMDSEGSEELRGRIVRAAEQAEEVRAAMADDEDLSEAKETAKEIAAPYRETLAMLAATTAYAVSRLNALGVTVRGGADE